MKKKTCLIIMAPLLFTALLIFAFTPTKLNRQRASYSGIDLFKGIFFKEGKVTRAIPELANDREIKSPDTKVKFVHKELLTKLMKNDPQFFENFKKDIQSGNPVKIESCLLRSQQEVVKQLKNIGDEHQASETGLNGSSLGAETSPYSIAAAIAPYTLALVLDFGVIKVSDASVLAPENMKSHSLQTEAFVFSIAKNLQN